MSSVKKPESILASFPEGRSPRPLQVEALLKIESAWTDSDVLVVDLPVASGKSLIAVTVARWALKQKVKSRLLTPTNLLVDQYLRDFPYLHTLPAAKNFKCTNSISRDEDGNELDSHSCQKEKSLGEKVYCSGCPYILRKKQGYVKPYGVYNLYTYLANKYYRPLLLVDEAHNLLPMLRDINAKKFWRSEYNYPASVRTYGQIYTWLVSAIRTAPPARKAKLEWFLKEITSKKTRFIVDRGMEMLRGSMEDCIKLLPVDVRDGGGLLWPAKKVQKLVLMSATINRKDVEELGLDKRRVTFISAGSAIPAKQRPIYVPGTAALPGFSMSFKDQEKNLPQLVQFLEELLAKRPEKGLVHLTYSLAAMLKLTELRKHPRLIWHSQGDKMQKYQEFLAAPEGTVLMASGLYEGIDLPQALGRWQVLTKVPYPSLESPAIQYMAENDPEWYANEAVKVVVQSVGRICRTPTDWGDSYVVDSSFTRLYDEYRELFPQSFQEAVVV